MNRMESKQLVKLIPFGLATLLVLAHVAEVFWMSSPEQRHLVIDPVRNAGMGLAIVFTLVLVRKPVWKHAFAVVALLATVSVFQFYSHTVGIRSGVLRVELVSFCVLFFHLALNPELFDPVKAWMRSGPEPEASVQARTERLVKGYRTTFRTKSPEELKRIVEQNVLVPEAVEAARRILEGR